jgi:hypothetical protein
MARHFRSLRSARRARHFRSLRSARRARHEGRGLRDAGCADSSAPGVADATICYRAQDFARVVLVTFQRIDLDGSVLRRVRRARRLQATSRR